MIYTAICDDYPAQTQIIKVLMEKYKTTHPGIEIKLYCFNSGAELLKSIDDGNIFNLFLLDILMPGLDGIELAKEIRKYDENAAIIFLTASKEHALEAYGVSAIQYILKPVKENVFFPVLNKVVPMINQKKESYFLLYTPQSNVKIPFSTIVCVKLNRRKLRVHLENGVILDGKYVRTSFEETVAPLLRDSRFISVHESFVINMEKVEELQKNALIMEKNIMVPVSRSKYAEVKKTYLEYVTCFHLLR